MFLIISMYNITNLHKIYIYYYKNENILNKISFYIQILLFLKQLLIKFTDPDIRTKKSRYPNPDSAFTDPTFYYPDPDSAFPDFRIGSRIESGSQIKVPGLMLPIYIFDQIVPTLRQKYIIYIFVILLVSIWKKARKLIGGSCFDISNIKNSFLSRENLPLKNPSKE